MEHYKADILSFFDDEVKYAINVLCKKINSSQADVFVLMAHKAVLLFFVLLDQGYIDNDIRDRIIVTNLSLGFDYSYFTPDMKVAIVDDIVISGTTIASAVDKLISIGINQDNIDVYTIALDRKYFNMSFVKKSGEQALHYGSMIEDAKCIELSAVISKAFSYLGVPYDVDFPVYQHIQLFDNQIKTLYNNILWSTTDISNQNQILGGVTALTLLPSKYTRERIWTSLGFRLEECVDLKLRLYIEKYPNGGIECRAVPMCLFREISTKDIDVLYNSLNSNEFFSIENIKATLRSKTRYLGYYISNLLFNCFRLHLNIGSGFSLNQTLLLTLFGPVFGNKVYSVLLSTKLIPCTADITEVKKAHASYRAFIDDYYKSKEYNEYKLDSASWKTGSNYELGCWMNYFILHPVIWWYREKEIKTRNILKDKSYHYVNDYLKIKQLLHRLQNGIPMGLLTELLKNNVKELPKNESELLICLFLDRAIDEGIIVPTLYFDEGKKSICRAYRHGEDLPFGDADKTRLVYFIQKIGDNLSVLGKEKTISLSAIALEKIIVLFYQIGLRKGGVFNRFLGFDNTDIIHSFLSIHGAIIGFTKHDAIEHIYSSRDEFGKLYIIWLTKWLSQKRLIKYNRAWEDIKNETTESNEPSEINIDNIKNYLNEEDRLSVVSEEVRGAIASIADLISQWYLGMVCNGKGTLLFKEHITALTSCSNEMVYASAIATEIHYFATFWKNQGSISMNQPDGNSIRLYLNGQDAKKHTDNTRKGLYSGYQKIGWYRDGSVERAITQSTDCLSSATDKNVWNNIWTGIRKTEIDYANKLKKLSNTADSYLLFYYACFECLTSVEYWESGLLPKEYEKHKKACLEYGILDSRWFGTLEAITKESEFQTKKDLFMRLLGSTTNMSEQDCVKEIEKIIWNYDSSFTVNYQSCLIIDIFAYDSSILNDIMSQFWNSLPQDEFLTSINIIRFPSNLKNEIVSSDTTEIRNTLDEYVKYGIFCNPVSNQSLDSDYCEKTVYTEVLLSYYKAICKALTAKVKRIRGIMIPEIYKISKMFFSHNLRRNIDNNCRKFYQELISHIESCYSDGYAEQLVVCLDMYSSINLDTFSKWEINAEGSMIPNINWIEKWYCFSRKYIDDGIVGDGLIDKILYSQVLIKCRYNGGINRGIGLLIKCSEGIICVTCNHLLRNCNKDGQCFATFYSHEYRSFPLKLHRQEKVKEYYNEDTILRAIDELIVLDPCWDGTIPLNSDYIVSLEDFTDLPLNGINCSIHAVNEDEVPVCYGPYVVQATSAHGYYQLISKDNNNQEQNKKGWSGGVYYEEGVDESRHKIVGMHEGRFDNLNKTRFIPSNVIIRKIKTIVGDENNE